MHSRTLGRWAVLAVMAMAILAGGLPAAAQPDPDTPIDQKIQQQSRDAAMADAARTGEQDFRDDFLNLAGPAAQVVTAEFSVPAAVAIAQGILESNWGRSTLTVNDRNYF